MPSDPLSLLLFWVGVLTLVVVVFRLCRGIAWLAEWTIGAGLDWTDRHWPPRAGPPP